MTCEFSLTSLARSLGDSTSLWVYAARLDAPAARRDRLRSPNRIKRFAWAQPGNVPLRSLGQKRAGIGMGGVVMTRNCKLVFSVQEGGVLIDCHPGGSAPRSIEHFMCKSIGDLNNFLSSPRLRLDNRERERIAGSCEQRSPCALILREKLCQADTIDGGSTKDRGQCPLWNQLTKFPTTPRG